MLLLSVGPIKIFRLEVNYELWFFFVMSFSLSGISTLGKAKEDLMVFVVPVKCSLSAINGLWENRQGDYGRRGWKPC